jgi:hypothetical protein
MKSQSSRRAEAQEAVTLGIRIQPRASKNGMARMADGTLKIRLTAPPVDGAANEALVLFLADAFGVPRSQVEILSGLTARRKVVRISGVSEGDALKVVREAGP